MAQGTSVGSIGSKVVNQGNAVDESMSGISGAQRTNDAHGRYTDLAVRSKIYVAANQAGKAVTNLAASATGAILSNDNSNTNWGALLNVGFIQTSTAATTANAGVSLAAGVASTTNVTHTTPLTTRLVQDYTTSATLKADDTATLPAAPVSILALWQPSVSASATTSIPPVVNLDLGGLLLIKPGCSLSLSALSTLSGLGSYAWEEFPAPTNYV